MIFDPYVLFLLGLGVIVLLIVWLPMALRKLPLSLSILCVGVGVAVFWSGALAFRPNPLRFSTITEHMTELVVIVALMGAGLKIDRRMGLRAWGSSWRLIAVTMPLSIAGATLMGIHGLGLGLASALLLASVLAPTDPVLASDVQVGPPGAGEEGEVRFALTSEAGLNDGFAFPFVHLAVAVAMAGGGLSQGLLAHWASIDVLWRVAAGVVVGWLVGKALGWLTFRIPHAKLSGAGDGLVALGATFVAYGVTEAAHGYGFLAVFIAALALRETERDHQFHEAMHDFAEQIERLLMLLVLVLFGGAIAGGLFKELTLIDMIFGLALLFVVRPAAGMIGLIGSPHPLRERATIAFLGIRGIGSFYYLAYGLNHGRFEGWDRLWAITGFVVLCSILLHGVTSTPVMAWLDRKSRPREAAARMNGGRSVDAATERGVDGPKP